MTGRRVDLTVAFTLALLVAAAAFVAVLTLDPRFLDPATGNDIWFEADLGRIADEMTHRWAEHSRATVHPLLSLITVGLAYAARAIGASPATAVSAVSAVAAAAWTLACYGLARTVVTRVGDAVLLVLVAAGSAAAQFWLTVPETAALGSASVMTALALTAWRTDAWITAGVAGSLSITVTNIAAGLISAATALPWRRAVQAVANGLAIVVVLWAVQRVVVPHADFFVGYSNEERYLLRPEAGGAVLALRSVAVNGMMMPRVERVPKARRGLIMTVQRTEVRAQSRLWTAGVVIWILLLASGGISLIRHRRTLRGYGPVVVMLAYELLLYAIYGTESFLYALNVVPLLVLVAGAGLRGRGRAAPLVRAALVALLTMAAVNNAVRLGEARGYFESGRVGRSVDRSSVNRSVGSLDPTTWADRSVGSLDPTTRAGLKTRPYVSFLRTAPTYRPYAISMWCRPPR